VKKINCRQSCSLLGQCFEIRIEVRAVKEYNFKHWAACRLKNIFARSKHIHAVHMITGSWWHGAGDWWHGLGNVDSTS
jgi:hypothetical protein